MASVKTNAAYAKAGAPAQAQAQATKAQTITLRGSAQIVTEFFGYSVNCILYNRGIYDPESFTTVKKYGLQMQVSKDPGLTEYLKKVLGQLSQWLLKGEVKQLVLVITGIDTNETLERWTFNVQTDQKVVAAASGAAGSAAAAPASKPTDKTEKEINTEIGAICRQIISSVSFLPLLEQACSFDLLVYTDAKTAQPTNWEESDPKYIAQSNQVRLRSFTTKIHKVDTTVAYKAD